MARYEHRGSVHMFKKKSSIGDVIGGIAVVFIVLAVIGALAG